MRKFDSVFHLALAAVALLCVYRFELIFVNVTVLLAMVGLVAVLKGGGWGVWLFLLLFIACAFLLTYRLLARLGLLKKTR